jgi:hypothetical protein
VNFTLQKQMTHWEVYGRTLSQGLSPLVREVGEELRSVTRCDGAVVRPAAWSKCIISAAQKAAAAWSKCIVSAAQKQRLAGAPVLLCCLFLGFALHLCLSLSASAA